METAAKIAAVCLLGAVLTALMKKTSPDTALLLALAVCVAVLAALARGLEEVTDFLRELLDWGQRAWRSCGTTPAVCWRRSSAAVCG